MHCNSVKIVCKLRRYFANMFHEITAHVLCYQYHATRHSRDVMAVNVISIYNIQVK